MRISDTLTPEDYQVIKELLGEISNISDISVEQIWKLMDEVWDDIGCNNDGDFDHDKIATFYKHPIWLLNGLFTEHDKDSLQHRHAIANWIVQESNNANKKILDFGGGYGTLARIITESSNSLKVDIYEPYPSNYALSRCGAYSSVNFVTDIYEKYDYIVSLDVLEHVPDPLVIFGRMIDSANLGGYLIIANCFYPVMKCHLSSTYHFRYSFDQFAEAMGLKLMGSCKGSHANIYKKISERNINWSIVRGMEFKSRNLFKLIEIKKHTVSLLRNSLKKLMTDPAGLLYSLFLKVKGNT